MMEKRRFTELWHSSIGYRLSSIALSIVDSCRPPMSKYNHFEELPVWQTAARLYNLVLDLLESDSSEFTPGFRGQLDRASLSVSNNIAEGFDRVTTSELLTFLGYAKGSASEVRSMVHVVWERPPLLPLRTRLQSIHDLAESCVRQIAAWSTQIDEGKVQGKRHLTAPLKRQRETRQAAEAIRLNFLRSLAPSHPLYQSSEALTARGEPASRRAPAKISYHLCSVCEITVNHRLHLS